MDHLSPPSQKAPATRRRPVFGVTGQAKGPKSAGAKPHAAKPDDTTRDDDKPADPHRWSHEVTEHSVAMDLEEGVFTLKDPKEIAASLKRSADASRRLKSTPFRSAMSMLCFYINRAGKKLPGSQKEVLNTAKDELRLLYGRAPAGVSGGEAEGSDSAEGSGRKRARRPSAERSRQHEPDVE